jgi:hypothetical protein
MNFFYVEETQRKTDNKTVYTVYNWRGVPISSHDNVEAAYVSCDKWEDGLREQLELLGIDAPYDDIDLSEGIEQYYVKGYLCPYCWNEDMELDTNALDVEFEDVLTMTCNICGNTTGFSIVVSHIHDMDTLLTEEEIEDHDKHE